jgi:hypothetical protein
VVGGRIDGMTNRRALGGVIALALVAAAVLWFFGLGVVPALGVADVVVAVGVVWTATRDGESLAWPVPPVRTEPGARRDLSEIAWALRSRGGVPERLIARVRVVARRRLLVGHQLDLDDPADRAAIERVLAPDVVAVLTSARRPELTLTSFGAVIAAVESIESAAPRPVERNA